MYQIIIKKEALKELKQLPNASVLAITHSIDELSENPRPIGCKKLKGAKGELWRIRVGSYRIIYIIDDVVRIVNVRNLGHRKDVYE